LIGILSLDENRKYSMKDFSTTQYGVKDLNYLGI
jgi:hypothetical protein